MGEMVGLFFGALLWQIPLMAGLVLMFITIYGVVQKKDWIVKTGAASVLLLAIQSAIFMVAVAS